MEVKIMTIPYYRYEIYVSIDNGYFYMNDYKTVEDAHDGIERHYAINLDRTDWIMLDRIDVSKWFPSAIPHDSLHLYKSSIVEEIQMEPSPAIMALRLSS